MQVSKLDRLYYKPNLYYITHINNVKSIIDRGILSNKLVNNEEIPYDAIHNENVIQRRKERKLNNISLLEYVNLYFNPRNAMLYQLVNQLGIEKLAMLAIKSRILVDVDNVYVTNGNAASSSTKFYSKKEHSDEWFKIILEIKNKALIQYWNEDSKNMVMAECLVSDRIDKKYITEIYVANINIADKLKRYFDSKGRISNLSIIPQPDLFFSPLRTVKLKDNLSLVQGDMFFSNLQTITISVNTDGVMGKGLASRTKHQFPSVYKKYRDLCNSKELKLGKPYIHKEDIRLDNILLDWPSGDRRIIKWFLLFPTKERWKKKSKVKYIVDGLEWLVNNYKKEGIESIALPALGCGLGGLD
ncbi:MAG: DarT ssDNA thymidine ADP-ribosyltransferase family protein [bacterium]|nr:DarT ssDNA thymidine ADP-ribosyltransferase family protein [bacterium]